jgi:hypothetical protein
MVCQKAWNSQLGWNENTFFIFAKMQNFVYFGDSCKTANFWTFWKTNIFAKTAQQNIFTKMAPLFLMMLTSWGFFLRNLWKSQLETAKTKVSFQPYSDHTIFYALGTKPPLQQGSAAAHHKVRTYKEYHSVCPSSELGLPPTPHRQASVPPPPCFWGEENTRWRERGWESPNSDEGNTLWYSLYVRTLCCALSRRKSAIWTSGDLAQHTKVCEPPAASSPQGMSGSDSVNMSSPGQGPACTASGPKSIATYRYSHNTYCWPRTGSVTSMWT